MNAVRPRLAAVAGLLSSEGLPKRYGDRARNPGAADSRIGGGSGERYKPAPGGQGAVPVVGVPVVVEVPVAVVAVAGGLLGRQLFSRDPLKT